MTDKNSSRSKHPVDETKTDICCIADVAAIRIVSISQYKFSHVAGMSLAESVMSVY
jgi:hypothetical protein